MTKTPCGVPASFTLIGHQFGLRELFLGSRTIPSCMLLQVGRKDVWDIIAWTVFDTQCSRGAGAPSSILSGNTITMNPIVVSRSPFNDTSSALAMPCSNCSVSFSVKTPPESYP